MTLPSVRPALASAAVYLAATLALGRELLGHLSTRIASDAGDPILNASILAWNGLHVPWTDAWYQFPIFFPTADTLTFSEHLLAISLVASPVYWTTGSAIAAYNVALLLSYPLCGLAMYALVWRLTGQPAAAFLAGLAYGFAPYRASQLPHIQMLWVFGAPLALLALHAFAGAGKWGWLALFAVCWLLQGAANGYMLVYFSVLVALWLLWFLVSARRWRETLLVAGALTAAVLPLAPILYRYVTTHRELGLRRNLGEIASFSADVAAPLCAPPTLTFWGWLRVACAPEGELFAGAGLVLLCVLVAVRRRRGDGAASGGGESAFTARRSVSLLRRMLLVGAGLYVAIAISVLVVGPWRIDLGWIRASASGADKPLSVALALVLVAFLVSPAFTAVVRRRSMATFYLGAALVCWVLSWGPFPRLFGLDALYQAPFAWLLQVPGVDGLRVPARFWMLTVLCLCAYMGIGMGQWLSSLSRRRRVTVATVAAIALFADGWMTIPAADIPARLADPSLLHGQVVLSLPAGDTGRDIAAIYHAVSGRWRSINGFSGYEPGYYEAFRTLARDRRDGLFEPFIRVNDMHVLVDADDDAMRRFVERQPGAHLATPVSRDMGTRMVHYRIPRRTVPAAPPAAPGERVAVSQLTVSCSAETAALVLDGDAGTEWVCGPQTADHHLSADLGAPVRVGAIVHTLGAAAAGFPRHLVIETSIDGQRWEPAWEGSPAAFVLAAALEQPRLTRVVFPVMPRPARYVRLRQTGRDSRTYWSIGELEVLGP